jgi:hypothetical protein
MADEKSDKKPELTRKAFPTAAKAIAAQESFPGEEICPFWDGYAEQVIAADCGKKQFVIHSSKPCPGGGKECVDARIPKLEPCGEIAWGDGANDHIETDDTEVLCIRICNPYSNVTFSDVIIHLSAILGPNGQPVQNLPDGTPSVYFKPSEQICFGDVGPCRDGRPTCVSREVVLVTCGAVPGPYQVFLGLCYKVCLTCASVQQFQLDLVAS